MAVPPFHSFKAEAFLRGDCPDVGAWFGPQMVPGEGLRLRAFLPRATRVELLDAKTGEALLDLTMVHPEGIFEAHLPRRRKPFPYRFRVHGWGEPVELVDPYRFGPVLGELDRYLHAEGTFLHSYERMGAHPAVREGVEGADFAVWAPNARRVSVVGTFNTWDGRRHILHRWSEAGIWELFVPHLRPGDLYKFEIDLSAEELDVVFSRGWRKFGMYYFKPACRECRECIPIRVKTDELHPSRSQKRVIRECKDIRVEFKDRSLLQNKTGTALYRCSIPTYRYYFRIYMTQVM